MQQKPHVEAIHQNVGHQAPGKQALLQCCRYLAACVLNRFAGKAQGQQVEVI